MKAKTSPDQIPGNSRSIDKALPTGVTDRLFAYRCFLVPIDFSVHSKKTIEYASQLAALTGGNIKVLHVFQIPEYPAAFYHGLYLEHEPIRAHIEAAKREANAQLSLVADEIRAQGLEAEPLLRAGNPYEEIVSASQRNRCRSHRDRVARLYRYRTFAARHHRDRGLQYAPCPVLVVKGQPSNRVLDYDGSSELPSADSDVGRHQLLMQRLEVLAALHRSASLFRDKPTPGRELGA